MKTSEKHKSASPSRTPREKQRQSFDTEDNLDIINLTALRLENRKLRNIAQNIILSSTEICLQFLYDLYTVRMNINCLLLLSVSQ